MLFCNMKSVQNNTRQTGIMCYHVCVLILKDITAKKNSKLIFVLLLIINVYKEL